MENNISYTYLATKEDLESIRQLDGYNKCTSTKMEEFYYDSESEKYSMIQEKLLDDEFKIKYIRSIKNGNSTSEIDTTRDKFFSSNLPTITKLTKTFDATTEGINYKLISSVIPTYKSLSLITIVASSRESLNALDSMHLFNNNKLSETELLEYQDSNIYDKYIVESNRLTIDDLMEAAKSVTGSRVGFLGYIVKDVYGNNHLEVIDTSIPEQLNYLNKLIDKYDNYLIDEDTEEEIIKISSSDNLEALVCLLK